MFVKNVLQGDFEADFFKRLTTVKKEEITDTTEEWVSWKAITDKDGVGVVKAQIQQGTIMTRQHAKLDPNHPATQELPPEEQLQYKKVQEPPDRRLKFKKEMLYIIFHFLFFSVSFHFYCTLFYFPHVHFSFFIFDTKFILFVAVLLWAAHFSMYVRYGPHILTSSPYFPDSLGESHQSRGLSGDRRAGH